MLGYKGKEDTVPTLKVLPVLMRGDGEVHFNSFLCLDYRPQHRESWLQLRWNFLWKFKHILAY